MTTKAQNFNYKTASLEEYNRELKRLASRKCRAKNQKEKDLYEKEYKALAEKKAEKFEKTKKQTYMTYSDDQIKSLDLETTIKAIKSLQSIRCVYPDKKSEVLKVENKYQEHKQELIDLAKLEELKNKYNL